MGKLKLKRTPAEERERELRKARKAAKRAAKLGAAAHAHIRGQSSTGSTSYDYVFDDPSSIHNTSLQDSDEEYGPQAAQAGPSTTGMDYARILAELEERRFREKLADAMEADAFDDRVYPDRLDNVESRMNDYAHVPRRWQSGSRVHMERVYDDGDERMEDPHLMEDEEYSEWIRRGMWRRTHAAEVEEIERQKQARAERKQHEKELREETKRMAREAEEARGRRRAERTVRRAQATRDTYETNWKTILASHSSDVPATPLDFEDVPWPIFPPTSDGRLSPEDITPEAIALFLLPAPSMIDNEESKAAKEAQRKDKLRETMLRFHPDKFEARILVRVHESDCDWVRDAMGRVVRGVGDLMKRK